MNINFNLQQYLVEFSNNQTEYLQSQIEQSIQNSTKVVFVHCSVQEQYQKLQNLIYQLQQKYKQVMFVSNLSKHEKCFDLNSLMHFNLHEAVIIHIYPECLCFYNLNQQKLNVKKYCTVFLDQQNQLLFQTQNNNEQSPINQINQQIVQYIKQNDNYENMLLQYHLYNYQFKSKNFEQSIIDKITTFTYTRLQFRNSQLVKDKITQKCIGNITLLITDMVENSYKAAKKIRSALQSNFNIKLVYIPYNGINEPKILNFEDTNGLFVVISSCQSQNLVINQKFKQLPVISVFELAVQLGIISYNVENYETDLNYITDIIVTSQNLQQ